MTKDHFKILIIVLFIFGFMLFLNYIQPLRADDYGRACTDVLSKGLIVMVHAIGIDYMTWTGRVSAQALIYILLSKKYISFSLFVVNIINSLTFTVFIFLVFKIVTFNKIKILSKDFVIYLLFFIFIFYQTGFIANTLWKTAAIQYFWGIALLVALYYLTIIKDRENISYAIFVGCFIGIYNEIFVAVSILFCVAFFLERKVYNQSVNKSIKAFFISCVISGCILLGAPGNYVRLDSMSHGAQPNVLDSIISLIYQIVSNPQDTFLLITMLTVFILFILSNKEIAKIKAFIYITALVALIFVLTPVVKSYGLNQRILLIYYVIFFIAMYQQFYCLKSKITKAFSFYLRKYFFIFIILFLIGQLYIIALTQFTIYQFEQKRNKILLVYKHNKQQNIILPCLGGGEANIYIGDISANPNAYANKAYAKFYDFKSVKCSKYI